jgi:hypothetical protein
MQHHTLRMQLRGFTRLTNAFSKKLDDHRWAVVLHFMHCSFCRIRQTLCVTPAIEAGVTDPVWSIDEVVSLLDTEATKAA